MNKNEIKAFLESFSDKLSRTIVVVDFGNVEKWKDSMGWKVGIQELAALSKHLSKGDKQLRRFYYGSDFGSDTKSTTLTPWSKNILNRAEWNRFEVVEKRVKYIHDNRDPSGFVKKCDLDVEMAVDLIKMHDLYDHIVVFSGDGDIAYALRYLKEAFGKLSYVFSARGHIGGEIVQGVTGGFIKKMMFAEDFEYRLNMERFRYT